jgi:hypothetical protein
MADLGVTFSRGDDGWVTPDFSRSKFSGGNQKDMNVLFNDLLKGEINFESAHKLKQEIRKNIDFDKGGKDSIDRASQAILKDLSKGIDDVLDLSSTKYKRANEKFAKTIGLKEKFDKMTGKEIDIFSDMAKVPLANKARRLSSNAESRGAIKQTLQDADEVLSGMGIKYKDNIPALVFITNRLEEVFKITPDNSLQGVIQKGIGNTVEGAISPLAAARNVSSKISEMTAPDFSKKMKALKLLVED